MAAYAAVTSLKNTIQRILQSSRISLDPPSPQILQPAYEEMSLFERVMLELDSAYSTIVSHFAGYPSARILQPVYKAMGGLQTVLLKLDDTSCSKIRTKVNALDELIKETVWKFEDLLESHVSNQILPQLQSSSDHLSFSVDLLSLRQHVDCFLETVKMMEVEYNIEVENMPEEEGQPISSRIDFSGINSKMVGLSHQFEKVRDDLLAENEGYWYSIVGMAGVGKTTLAKKVFDDPSIRRHFEFRAWVKVGRKCDSNETLGCILAQVDPNTYDQMLTQGDDDKNIVGVLEERLKGKKCLIVMDDVWEPRVLDDLLDKNVQILITSRLGWIASPSQSQEVRLLNEEDSKELLGEKVFGDEGFPIQLDKLGGEIAKKCEGLPLMIVTVAELISKADNKNSEEYWTEVAKQHSSVFVDAYDQILEVLFPSYDYLPQYLKMVFLYMGSFPPYSDIHPKDLSCKLIAEGFLEPIGEQTCIDLFSECLAKLIWYHLVLFASNPESWFTSLECRVHSCWQHLCKKEASKIKFMHVIQSCYDDMKGQRRLCTHSNMLFVFEQVYGSIQSDCASTARSLLCLGPYHQYPAPIDIMGFKLLRVLDAVRLRLYHIPLEILKLVCLHYLGLTCNGELPASISNLFHLQFLLINRHMNIKKRGVHSYMPMEIWDMQELQHIQVLGRDLPNPNSDATLNKLLELAGVSAKSCTREVLKSIPNLTKLAIEMELKPYDDDSDPLSSLSYISQELQNLELLIYDVVNPEIKYECMIPLSMFPSSLRRLELSGLGCPWKLMNNIGSLLPNLGSLNLRSYAFQGPEWDIELGCFLNLERLLIEDTNLVRWRAQRGSFPKLHLLSIRHCYRLQQLDWTCDRSGITTIELVDCNPLGVTSAKQLPESLFKVMDHSSF